MQDEDDDDAGRPAERLARAPLQARCSDVAEHRPSALCGHVTDSHEPHWQSAGFISPAPCQAASRSCVGLLLPCGRMRVATLQEALVLCAFDTGIELTDAN